MDTFLRGAGQWNSKNIECTSKAWLTDPCDTNWDERCDLVSDDEIDIEDYAVFCENWLWQACWRDSSEETWMMMAGGDFSKMAASQAQSLSVFKTDLLIESQQESSLTAKSQLTFAEQVKQLINSIDFLEEIWEDDEVQKHIDKKVWSDFMDSIYEHLKYLEEQL